MKLITTLASVILITLLVYSCEKKATSPVLTTNTVTSISTTTAVSGGKITDDGGAAVSAKGVCWNISDQPTVDNSKSSESSASGSFTSNLSQLAPGTTYYVRAYATNSVGTSYGGSVTFKTLGDKPVAQANSASNITFNSATLGATINPNQLSTTLSFEWGTSISYGNTIIVTGSPVSGSTSSVVSVNLTGLKPETTYHFRINATNDLGITNSDDMQFTTLRLSGWVKVKNVPLSPRNNLNSFIIGDRIYLGSGVDGNWNQFNDWWMYSIPDSSWKQLADFPKGKTSGFSVSMNGKGYLCRFSDEVGRSVNELWEFNPDDNSWTRLSDFPGSSRTDPAYFVINDQLFVGTGIRLGKISLTDFFVYNQTAKSWSQIKDYPGDSIYGSGTFTIGKEAHFLTGVVNNTERTKIHYKYDSNNDSWVELDPFPGSARIGGCGFSIMGMGYFGFGSINSNYDANDLWKYNPDSKSWTSASNFIGPPRTSSTYGSNGKIGYYGFGYKLNTYYNDLYLYYPENQ